MASSTSGLCGSTPAPPPPTPSNQTIPKSRSVDAEVALSLFLNQLELNQATPSLSSLPPRFSKKPSPPPPPSSTPPVISFTDTRHDLLLLAASDTGFFHLADHGISSDIFNRATNESQALFNSKPVCSVHSSLGLNRDDGDEDIRGKTKFLVFDTSSGELDRFPATSEYAKSLERVGLEVVELILSTAGFDNPFRKATIKPKCLMWVSSSFDSTNVSVIKEEEEEEEEEGGEMQQAKCYPYVVSLQYEMKACSIMGESGSWIAVDPCVGSVLVTLGDIAQVWSNGRFKKMRGTPRHASFASSDYCDDLQSLSMTLLVTLPVDALVSPLLSKLDADDGDVEEDDDECEVGRRRFRPFSFEEYAWRVYHERLPFNDPLIKYQI